MSVYGYVFFVMGLLCGALSIGTSLPEAWSTLAKGGVALFAVLFTVSLVVGRRIKFDPILR
ncbi:PA3371 family protein [Stutzerimonas zhaodongensis]|uniref:PA3371 family protein n=2 Tax=Stutzerimonas TaxID=2901164 RepID=UPI00388E3731